MEKIFRSHPADTGALVISERSFGEEIRTTPTSEGDALAELKLWLDQMISKGMEMVDKSKSPAAFLGYMARVELLNAIKGRVEKLHPQEK